MTKVLLTGGSGFIAAHILELLLQRGHEVVTTVRTEEKASKIRAAHPEAKLTIVIVPDIAQEGAFDEVVKTPGVEAVLHTASPFHFNITDPKRDLLDPAIIGTTGILKAIKRSAPQVKRVVITSSFASILDASRMEDPTKIFSEADWNPNTYEDGIKGPSMISYRVSKVLAERAAWKFVEVEKPNFDLATICPPLVFGPVVHHLNSLSAINTSNARFVSLIRGEMKKEIAPTGTYLWVDVRDVALAHVMAMEKPEAGGKRFFCTAGKFSNRQMVDVVRKNFPELKDKLPDEDVKGGDFPAGGSCGYDNSRASTVLGIKWHTLEESATDTVRSLLAVGA